MAETKVDPILLSVVWSNFISVCEEMGSTLRRTAFSSAVREADDFSTAVFDGQGRLIAQGNYTPGHLGSMPYVVRSVLEHYPGDMLRPGDVVMLNDSFLGSGHFPDIFFVSPVFSGPERIGFVVNTAHHVDVGGGFPGSQRVQGVSEAYQEGLRVLPVRLFRGGEVDEDLMRLILGNVRFPETVRGDLLAQRNANALGALRLDALYQQYGRAGIEDIVEEILTRSEEQMRADIARIPDGTYSFEDCLDDCGTESGLVHIRVKVTVEGSDVTVDFSDSDDAVPAALNSYINYTRAYSIFTIRVLSGSKVPHNDGCIRPVKVVSREGSFCNPQFPAASGGRAIVQIRLFEAINGALAKAMPHVVTAGFSHLGNPNMAGVDKATGKPFMYYDILIGGYGAYDGGDGAEALAPVVNCANIPIEAHEATAPILVRRAELIQDSGGDGQYRGGCGLRKDIELLADSAEANLLSDRHVVPPYGLNGGSPGALARTSLIRDGQATALSSKQVCRLRKGDVLSFSLSGGGGYGPVSRRDPAAVAADVADGYVSRQKARDVYGMRDELPFPEVPLSTPSTK